jgi:hypothetical protein
LAWRREKKMMKVIDDTGEDMTEIAAAVEEACRLQPVKEAEIVYEVPHWLTTKSKYALPDIYYQY